MRVGMRMVRRTVRNAGFLFLIPNPDVGLGRSDTIFQDLTLPDFHARQLELLDDILEDLHRQPEIEQGAKHHIPGDSRKGVEIGNLHGHDLPTIDTPALVETFGTLDSFHKEPMKVGPCSENLNEGVEPDKGPAQKYTMGRR